MFRKINSLPNHHGSMVTALSEREVGDLHFTNLFGQHFEVTTAPVNSTRATLPFVAGEKIVDFLADHATAFTLEGVAEAVEVDCGGGDAVGIAEKPPSLGEIAGGAFGIIRFAGVVRKLRE